jgi:hypothetical protein
VHLCFGALSSHIDGARESKIGNDGIGSRQQDVLGLDVQVDDGSCMRVHQRPNDLLCEVDGLGGMQA